MEDGHKCQISTLVKYRQTPQNNYIESALLSENRFYKKETLAQM